MIKLFQWIVWASAALCCFGWWLIASLTWSSIDFALRGKGFLLPVVTVTLLENRWWIVTIPLPYLCYLFITCKKPITVEAALIFVSTMVLGVVVVSFLVMVACILPWLPHHA